MKKGRDKEKKREKKRKKKRIPSNKQVICGAMCRHRWLANLTMHPHAKRCTYLRNGALHARRAFTLERVFNDTCTISDPYERGVSVHLYLYPCLFYLSHASLLSYRYSPYVARSLSDSVQMHHHPPRGFYLFPLSSPQFPLSRSATEPATRTGLEGETKEKRKRKGK